MKYQLHYCGILSKVEHVASGFDPDPAVAVSPSELIEVATRL